jgi:hypothetical protein
MPLKISATLLSLTILAGLLLASVRVFDTVTGDHDGWDIFAPVEVTSDPLTVEPARLLSRDDRETIEKVVVDGRRDWGLPFSVEVIESTDATLNADELAAQRFSEQPVESSEDAGDGLLMLVVVPEEDHTQTEVAFVTGPNFYPMGGLTQDRLDYIADVQMAALIEEDRIGDAVIEGATWVLWTHLFEPTPDAPATNLESGLQELLVPIGAAAIAALAIFVALAAIAVHILTLRGSVKTPVPDGLLAAATTRGRVDRAVGAGVILDAIDRGVVSVGAGGVLSVDRSMSSPATAWDAEVADAVESTGRRGAPPTVWDLARHLDTDTTLRGTVEDTLATAGFYYPKSPLATVALRWIAFAGAVLGAIVLVISVIGEAAPAVAAAIALTAVSMVVLIWNERRSWATLAGRSATRRWREAHTGEDDRERLLYETIVGMETVDLLPESGSPLRPNGRRLVTALNP